jgi:hypothetical protein
MSRALTPGQQELVRTHLDVVSKWYAYHRRAYPRRFDRDEMMAEGLHWLCRAAARYRPEIGVMFKTYAKKVIRFGVRAWANRHADMTRNRSQDRGRDVRELVIAQFPCCADSDDEFDFAAAIPDHREPDEWAALLEELHPVLRWIDAR